MSDHFYCWGGSPTQDQKAWQASVAQAPNAFVKKLAPLSDLVRDKTVAATLKYAIDLYLAIAANAHDVLLHALQVMMCESLIYALLYRSPERLMLVALDFGSVALLTESPPRCMKCP